MVEFINDEQKVVSVGAPIIFENKTDASFEVSAGIVFRKSGVYEVSIVGNKTIVSKVAGCKKGYWILDDCDYERRYICSECKLPFRVETFMMKPAWRFCPNCGCRMDGESE